MINSEEPNPFRILMLPTNATLAEITSREEDLLLIARDEEQERQIRWASEQLKANPRVRLEYELFELPDTSYEDETWETFARLHRRRPGDATDLTQEAPTPGLEDLDLTALTRLLLEDLTSAPEANLEGALNGVPSPPPYTLPLTEWDAINE